MIRVSALLVLSAFLFSCSSWTNNYKAGDKVNGFTLDKVVEVPEIEGKAYFFIHNKTKAPLLYLSNDDKNKTFGIAFKTPPVDSTGVFHIFEHSVLAGTRKYPSKSLFFQVAGSSVNTFQNAMTYSDKTFYPVASTNEQDFENLVDIYLDSVFFPQVLSNQKIFEREGWRYETKGDQLAFNGVVFSEMKGAYANPERFLWRETARSLFSEKSPYYYESGGDIVDISDLTFEQLQSTHKKYYHPGNSYILFYGDGPIGKHLAMVDKEYLSQFDARDEKVEIAVDTPKKKFNVVKGTYPADSSQKNLSEKVMHTRNFVMKPLIPGRDYFGLLILQTALSSFEDSPLKKTLVSKGICSEVDTDLDLLKQPAFSVVCKGSTSAKARVFSAAVDKALNQALKNGLSQKLLDSAMNKVEFQLREYSSIHRGLILGNRVLNSWLYGGPALEYVRYNPPLEWIRKEAKQEWFSDLLKNYIVSSNHQSLVSVAPDTRMMARTEKRLEAKLAKAKKNIESIRKQETEFNEWNNASVPAEVQAKIPKLKVSDLSSKAKIIPQEVSKEGIVTLLEHPIAAQGIVYASFYFDLNNIPEAWVPYLPLLADSLGKVRTSKNSYEDIDLKIYEVSGGLSAGVSVFPQKGNANLYDARFQVQIKALESEFPKALELLKEVVLETRFDSEKRMAEIFRDSYSQMESSLGRQAIYFSLLNTKAKLNLSGRFNNAINGTPQLMFLRDENKKKAFGNLNKKLQEIATQIFQKKGLVVALGFDSGKGEMVTEALQSVLKDIPIKEYDEGKLTFANQMLFDAAAFSGQVQFMSIFSMPKIASTEYGGLLALSKLVSYQFINPQIREQGGAYGGGMTVSPAGELGYYTYRDPRLDESYQDLLKIPSFLSSFPKEQSRVDSAILATIGDLDTPLTAQQQVSMATAYYFQHITPADLQEYRDQVFALDVKEVHGFAKDLETALSDAKVSVVGYRPKLEKSSLIKNKKIISL